LTRIRLIRPTSSGVFRCLAGLASRPFASLPKAAPSPRLVTQRNMAYPIGPSLLSPICTVRGRDSGLPEGGDSARRIPQRGAESPPGCLPRESKMLWSRQKCARHRADAEQDPYKEIRRARVSLVLSAQNGFHCPVEPFDRTQLIAMFSEESPP
jgi:hypothetical protein